MSTKKEKSSTPKENKENSPLLNNYLEKILRGERITKVINVPGRGKFMIALPLPSDLNEIEIRVAEMLGGHPQHSFSEIALGNFRAFATLDYIVIDGPEWWKSLESSQKCPDMNVIQTIYRGYLRFYKETQRSISGARLGKGLRESSNENKEETVAGGAFSEVDFES